MFCCRNGVFMTGFSIISPTYLSICQSVYLSICLSIQITGPIYGSYTAMQIKERLETLSTIGNISVTFPHAEWDMVGRLATATVTCRWLQNLCKKSDILFYQLHRFWFWCLNL